MIERQNSTDSALVGPGQCADLLLQISESYCGSPIQIPMRVMRGEQPGPAIFVVGAVHGDELNGTGIVCDLIQNEPFLLRRGTLMLIPVVNLLGFERHSRYMPDRRDLNRSFPGSKHGSLAARLAHRIFQDVVRKCDFGIDLHTAANFRTNIPTVRADLSNARARRIAEAFGCEVIINSRGPRSSLRRTACDAGCATIALEAGEPWRIEPQIVEAGVRGVRHVLKALEMIEATDRRNDVRPSSVNRQSEGSARAINSEARITADRWTANERARRPLIAHTTMWVRAADAGLLRMHVSPGERVTVDQTLATTSDLLGSRTSSIRARAAGIVVGMTTLPAVKPGDPVCHIAIPDEVPES